MMFMLRHSCKAATSYGQALAVGTAVYPYLFALQIVITHAGRNTRLLASP